jgi:hypothetical protein
LATGEGSHVQVSLAATAAWLDGLGRVTDGLTVVDPTFDDVADLLVTDDTTFGPVTHLRPPGHIDGAPPSWASPPHRPGADRPVWL